MKRILLSLVTLCLSFTLCDIYAQEHLSFKGIPIEGSKTYFCQQLESKGFKSIGTYDNISFFNGFFAGSEALISVVPTSDKENVLGVTVSFPASGEWKDLEISYHYYKQLYSSKYGKPLSSLEKNPSKSDSNLSLMMELEDGKVKYQSIWKDFGGFIILSIDKAEGYHKGQVNVAYGNIDSLKTIIHDSLDDI